MTTYQKIRDLCENNGFSITNIAKKIPGLNVTAAAMARSGEYFALQVHGNSMEPRIFSGDVVILRKQDTCDSGQIAAV